MDMQAGAQHSGNEHQGEQQQGALNIYRRPPGALRVGQSFVLVVTQAIWFKFYHPTAFQPI